MDRTELFDLMGALKLVGMKAAFDEIMATAVKRQHEPQRVLGELLRAGISRRQRPMGRLGRSPCWIVTVSDSCSLRWLPSVPLCATRASICLVDMAPSSEESLSRNLSDQDGAHDEGQSLGRKF